MEYTFIVEYRTGEKKPYIIITNGYPYRDKFSYARKSDADKKIAKLINDGWQLTQA